MELICNETFTDICVSLDNKHFINCDLIGCILEYSGGEIVFEQSRLRACRHVFFGRARRTLHYLQGVGLMPFDAADWAEFSDHVN